MFKSLGRNYKSSYGKTLGVALFCTVALLLVLFLSPQTAQAAVEETLTVSHPDPPLPDASIPRGAQNPSQDLVGDILRLHASPGDHSITVNMIRVRQDATATAMDSDIALVKLVRDANGNDQYDSTDTETIASTTTAGGVAEFNTLSLQVAQDSTVTIFIVYQMAPNATLGSTVRSNLIFAQGDVSVVYDEANSPDTVADFGTLTGRTLTTVKSTDTITVSGPPVADFSSTQETTGTLDIVTLTAPDTGDGAEISSLKVAIAPTAEPTDVEYLKLYEDVDKNGALSEADTAIDTQTPNSQEVMFAIPGGLSINPGAANAKQLLIEAKAAKTATPGAVIKTTVADAGYIGIVAPDAVGGAFPQDSAAFTVTDQPDKLTISQSIVNTDPIPRDANDRLVQVLDLSVDQDRTRLNELTINLAGTSTDTAIKSGGVKLWLDSDDSGGLNTGDTTLSAAGSFSGGSVTFTGINLEVIKDQPKKVLVSYSVDSNATLDTTLGAQVLDNSKVVLENSDTADVSPAPLVSGLHEIVESADTLSVTHSPRTPSPFSSIQGSTEVLDVLTLTASDTGDGVAISNIRIDIDAEASATIQDVAFFKLYEDLDNDGTLTAGDNPLDQKTPQSLATTFDLPADFKVGRGQTRKLLVIAETSPVAKVGATLITNIANASYIAVAPGETVLGSFPMTSASLVIDDAPDVLNIGQSILNTDPIARDANDRPIQIIELRAQQDRATLKDLTISRVGGADSDIKQNGVKLWLDKDNSGTLNSTDTTLAPAQSFNAGEATFAGINLEVGQDATTTVLVTYSVSSTATVGATLGAEVTNSSKVVLADPDTVNLAPTPLTSGLHEIVGSADTILVENAPTTTTSAAQDDTVTLSALTFTAPDAGDGAVISTVTVDMVDTETPAMPSDISFFSLYEDKNGDGKLDGGDSLLDTKVPAGISTSFKLPDGFKIEPGAINAKKLLLVAKLAQTATVGATLQLNLANAGYIEILAPDDKTGSFPMSSAAVAITDQADTLRISQSIVNTDPVARDANDRLIQVLDLEVADHDRTTIQSLTIDLVGNATETAVKPNGIKLWLDKDNSGTLNSTDTTLAVAPGFSNGSATFSGIDLEVIKDQPKKVLITYSISDSAQTGADIGARIFDSGKVVLENLDTADVSPTPLVSGLHEIVASADDLSVTHSPRTPSPFAALQGASEVLDTLTLTAPDTGDGVEVRSISFDLAADALPADIASIKLYEDLNKDGTLTVEDTLVASELPSSGTTKLILPAGYKVDKGEVNARSLFVVAEVALNTTPGKNLALNIPLSSYIEVSPNDTVSGGFPMTTASLTVEDLPDTVELRQTTINADPVARDANDRLIQILDVSTDQDKAILDAVTVARVGDATDTAVKNGGVKLWLDSNGNGALDSTDTALSSPQSFGNSSATFGSVGLEVTSTAQRLFVTYSIASTATVGTQIGAQIAPGAATAAVPDSAVVVEAPLTSGMHAIEASVDTLTVSHPAPTNFSAAQDTTQTLDALTLTAAESGDGAEVATITVNMDALASDVFSFYLYEDVDKDGTLSASDVHLDTKLPAAPKVSFSIPADKRKVEPGAANARTFLILAKIAKEASVGNTVGVSLTDASYIGLATGDTVDGSFPMSSSSIRIADAADILELRQSVLNTDTIARDANDKVVQILDLKTDQDKATLSSLTLRRTGDATDSAVKDGGVKLWLDKDGSNSVSDGDTTLSATSFSLGVATFSDINLEVTSTVQKLLVTYSIAANAPLGAQIGAEVQSDGAVAAEPDTAQVIDDPLLSGMHTIVSSIDSLSVEHTNPSVTSIMQDETQTLDVLTLTAPDTGDGATVSTVTVDLFGDALPSDVAFLYLYEDVNKDGTLTAGDSYLDSKTGAPQVSFSVNGGLKIEPGAANARQLLILAKAAPQATVGKTIRVNLATSDYVGLLAPDTVSGSFPMSSASLTITDKADVLRVEQTTIDTESIPRDANDRLIQILDVSTDQDKATLDSLTINRTGDATDSAVKSGSVKLWKDADQSGSFDAAIDTTLSTTSFSESVASFSGIGLEATSAVQKLFVTYSIAADATVDSQIGAQVVSLSAVQPDNSEIAGGTLSSGLHQIVQAQDTVMLSHPDPTTFDAAQDSTATLDTLIFTAPDTGDGATISTVTVDLTGDASLADIDFLYLYQDPDKDGIVTAEDLLDSKTPEFKTTFTISGGLRVDPGVSNSKHLVIVAKLAPQAEVGKTAQINIADSNYIGVLSPDSLAGTFPMSSSTATITDKADLLRVSQSIVNTDSVPRDANDRLIQILDVSTDQDKAILERLSIDITGDASDTAVKQNGVKLWLDANSSGSLDSSDTTLSVQSFSGGVADFNNLSLEVTSTVQKLLVTYSIAADAPLGKTLGAQVTDSSRAGAASPDQVQVDPAPLASGLHTIINSSDALEVTHSPRTPSPFNAEQGTNNVLNTLTLKAPDYGDGVNVESLKVYLGGTALPSDVAFIRLYEDVDKDGTLTAGDNILDSVAPTTAETTLTIQGGLVVNPGAAGTRQLLLAAEPSLTGEPDTTIQLNISSASDIKVSEPDTVTGSFPMSSAVMVITDSPDIVNISNGSVEDTSVIVGTANHIVQSVELTVPVDSAKITSLTFRRTGSASDLAIAPNGVKLWYDGNHDGQITAEPDWQVSASKTFIDGVVTFDNIDLNPIKPAEPMRLFLTYSVAADAATDIGQTLGASIESTAGVGVGSDIAVLSATPLESPLHTIMPTAPTAPTGLLITANAGSRFTLDWKDNPVTEKVTEYKIYRSGSSDGVFNLIGGTTSSSFEDTVPVPGSYWYKLSAINSTGESRYSAAETNKMVDVVSTVSSDTDTTTIVSADDSVKLMIPGNPLYVGKQFSIKSATKPSGVRVFSRFYFEFSTDATQTFNPPLTMVLKHSGPKEVAAIYHYTADKRWEQVPTNTYIYPDTDTIGSTNITSFSGYTVAQIGLGSYNYPLQYTDTATAGPHGGYTSSTNKCKECHAVHLAQGSYMLTRENSRNKTCEFCHGVGGAASKQIELDEGGHGLSESQKAQGVVTAPDDTIAPYTKNTADWGCLECHSVHDTGTTKLAGFSTNKLLKADPNPLKNNNYLYYKATEGESTQTLSQWCSACHNANFGFGLDGVVKTVPGDETTKATVYGHPSSELGSITMPDGFAQVNTTDTINNGPTCMQCHVADDRTGTSEFPHASGSSPSMLKTGVTDGALDNVCVSCHNTELLP